MFSIKHYAGLVKYNPETFLFKNKDELSQDLVDLIKTSESTFIHNLLAEKQPDVKSKYMQSLPFP